MRVLLWFALLLQVSCGGAPNLGPEPICFEPQPAMDGESGATRDPRAEEWAQLLLGDSARLGQRAPSQSCNGQGIAWPSEPQCGNEGGSPQAVQLTEDSVITRRLSATTKLVWVVTHRYEDGEGLGPVALVEKLPEVEEHRPEGWAVRVVGPLRSYTGRPRLRLEGQGHGSLLVAEGDDCEDPAADPGCERHARLVPVVDDRFAPQPVRTRSGRCVGAAVLHVSRKQTVELGDGWTRAFELATSFQYASGTLTVHEQVTADDTPDGTPEVPPRRFRLVDSDRAIVVSEGRLIARGAPLWDRMLRLHGGTALTEQEVQQEVHDR